MNKMEYAAFEAIQVAGNKILICIPSTYHSQYDRETFREVMVSIRDFIPESFITKYQEGERLIKLNNGSSITVITHSDQSKGISASELIFTHPKEDYDPAYIYSLLLCVQDKKHRRIIGI